MIRIIWTLPRVRLGTRLRDYQEINMKPLLTAVLVLAIAATATGASAQSNPPHDMGPMGSMPMHHPMGGMMGHQPGSRPQSPRNPVRPHSVRFKRSSESCKPIRKPTGPRSMSMPCGSI